MSVDDQHRTGWAVPDHRPQAQQARGERIKAFFGCVYFAALRPEEVIDLHLSHFQAFPMTLASGERYGSPTPNRGLGAGGPTPADCGNGVASSTAPTVTRAMCRSIPSWCPCRADTWRSSVPALAGVVFIGPRGGEMTDRAYPKVFHQARRQAFTPDETASPLMDVPHVLRHAAVSTWLNADVPAPQVAEWAGHSVNVLLRVYAKCIVGQDTIARKLIVRALESSWEAD